MRLILMIICCLVLLSACSASDEINFDTMNQSEKVHWFKNTSNIEKKEILTPQEYHVLVEKKMEATFIGKNTYNNKEGNYYSRICDYHIFSSEDKFNGKTGYLDFENINLSSVQFKEQYRSGQIEIYSICGEYIGYVIDNDALSSGKHFIANSQSLEFKK